MTICDAVPHRAGVRSFSEVTEICLPLANVLDFDIHITEPAQEHRGVKAIVIDVGLSRTDTDIKVKADGTKPGARIAGRQADRVIARVMRGKRELALGRTTRMDDGMATFHLL